MMLKDNKKKKYIKIKNKKAQEFLLLIKKKLKDFRIIDEKYKILKDSNHIYFPLIDNQLSINNLKSTIKKFFQFEIVYKQPIKNFKFKYKNIQKALENDIPKQYFKLIPKSFDIIGNIALVEFKNINNNKKKISKKFKLKIAEALLDINKNVISVFEKRSKIKGEYRIRDLKFLTGKNKTITVHKENNCVFYLDVKKMYFTPRLVFERKRIALNEFKEKEIIVDMFAGVGPFSIQIAKNHDVIVYAFDKNSFAYEYLKKNIKHNKLLGNIIPYNMDVKELLNPLNKVGNILKNNVNRILMNLPEKSLEFINVACFLMKSSGGILHNYQFCNNKPNPIEIGINNLKLELKKNNWYIDKIICSKIVKSFSPKLDLVVIDSLIKPNK
ncbi:MAG: class I SAM-dependent methyltransferase [Promethearchaeota archaeon]